MKRTAARWVLATAGLGLAVAGLWPGSGAANAVAAPDGPGVCEIGTTGRPTAASAADSTETLSMEPLSREPMEATGRAPGASGALLLSYTSSPYGLAVADDGRPIYRVAVETRELRVDGGRTAVAWAATPDLDRVRRLGDLGPDGRISVRVDWSRFLIFVTAEPSASSGGDGQPWTGPVLLVGRAPSSRMHTMRGHGIFEAHGIGC